MPQTQSEVAVLVASEAEQTGRQSEGLNFVGGCNAAASNAQGLGIGTVQKDLNPENWTATDQNEEARTPQRSQVIGGSGWVDRSSNKDWTDSGGVEGKGTVPIQALAAPDSQASDGTLDPVNGVMNLASVATGWTVGAAPEPAPIEPEGGGEEGGGEEVTPVAKKTTRRKKATTAAK